MLTQTLRQALRRAAPSAAPMMARTFASSYVTPVPGLLLRSDRDLEQQVVVLKQEQQARLMQDQIDAAVKKALAEQTADKDQDKDSKNSWGEWFSKIAQTTISIGIIGMSKAMLDMKGDENRHASEIQTAVTHVQETDEKILAEQVHMGATLQGIDDLIHGKCPTVQAMTQQQIDALPKVPKPDADPVRFTTVGPTEASKSVTLAASALEPSQYDTHVKIACFNGLG